MKKPKPDAFDCNFPIIREAPEFQSPAEYIRPCKYYKMGKLHIMIQSAINNMPLILSVSHNNRYPTWDEMVWIRYQLCPDNLDMAFILPPLHTYINYEDGRGKYTFTMEAVKRFNNDWNQ